MGAEGPPRPNDPIERVRRILRTDDPKVAFVREAAAGVLLVALLGLLVFGLSGVWPPLVAVESPSMTPNLQPGDLVLVVEEHRVVPPGAVGGTGVTSYRAGLSAGHASLGEPGDVIVYSPDGDADETPIIHRAHFWVNESENWYGKADPRFVGAGGCGEIPNCPAPHAGFVTKGDANTVYDQVDGMSGPVRPSWIRGTAEARVPYLGHVRLAFDRLR